MDNESNSEIIYQEIRYNFMRGSFTNGSFGLNYFLENRNLSQSLFSNDELITRLLSAPGSFMMPGQSRFPVYQQPFEPIPVGDIQLESKPIVKRYLINEKPNRCRHFCITPTSGEDGCFLHLVPVPYTTGFN
jgi:hypothetical protein